MNVLTACNILSPNEIEEECAHFTITDTEQPFVLNEIAKPDEQYTFSAWVKGSGEISISGNKFPVTEEWTRCVITFISDSTDVEIYFRETGDYYFYNSQLEVGEKDTDYSPAPEDLENRVTDAETVIRVHAGLIEQKVSVNGVISAINQSAEEIRISASKITLAGETIADAFTCTNLTVAGDSKADSLTLVDALYGTYKLDGVIQVEKTSKVITFGIGQLLELKVDSYQGNGKWIRMSTTTLGKKELWNYFENSCVFNGKVSIGQAIVRGNVNFERSVSIYADAFVGGALNVDSDLTVGGSVIPSVISWYPSSNTNFDEIQLRLSGSTGTQGISFVTVKGGTTSVFGNIFDANNRFMPDFPVTIYKISTYSLSSSSTVANGSSATVTTTITAIPSRYSYIVVPLRINYGFVSGYNLSGTTLSITLTNVSGGTHTLAGTVAVIIYKNRW